MRVALLSHNAQAGDALANQLAEKLAFSLDRGADAGAASPERVPRGLLDGASGLRSDRQGD